MPARYHGTAGAPWHWAGRTVASVLAVVAGVLFLLQISVREPGSGARSCGSSWDAVAGRTGWQQWWNEDLADTASQPGRAPLRTLECPSAINQRILISGGLAVAAVVTVAAGEIAGRRYRRDGGARPRRRTGLRTFSAVLIIVGCLLTVSGLAGIALLVADPNGALFVYVSRPVVALAGSLLVVPAVFIAALGMTGRAVADVIERERGGGANR